MNVAANHSPRLWWLARTAAGGYADVAECDAAFNELGVQMFDRYLALSAQLQRDGLGPRRARR